MLSALPLSTEEQKRTRGRIAAGCVLAMTASDKDLYCCLCCFAFICRCERSAATFLCAEEQEQTKSKIARYARNDGVGHVANVVVLILCFAFCCRLIPIFML